jgi:NADH-quinone oxidoreductase subunit E
MLTEIEKQEIDKEIKNYPRKSAAGLEAMRIVQKHRRWISDDTLKDIGDYLEMSLESLDSLATFYNLIFRQPVGRHVILICNTISCWIKGCDNLIDFMTAHLKIPLGGTTKDDRFTLIPIACLGACDKAPAMMVDEDLHVELTKEKILNILDKYK